MQRAYPAPEDPAPAWEVAAMSQHSAGLAEDAKRLAELREARKLYADHLWTVVGDARPTASIVSQQLAVSQVDALIAVYEECAARGLTFGGSR